MEDFTIERLSDDALTGFQSFCYEYWPGDHPLIHRVDMFEYYYRANDGGLNFAVARDSETGGILGVCGFIPANTLPRPDIWISYILTRRGGPLTLSLSLLDWVRDFTNCRTLGCNNIRKSVRGIYEFIGCRTNAMSQYYRYNPNLQNYTICNIQSKNILPVRYESLHFTQIETTAALEAIDFAAFSENQPYKDRHYLQKRFIDNPWIQYEFYAGRDDAGTTVALLALRAFRQTGALALRVVDYVGQSQYIPSCGGFLDRLMRERRAEFVDWFTLGVDPAWMALAGLQPLQPNDPNIIPLYLDPPVMENTTLYACTDGPADYRIFRADGDQDRPNFG